MNILSSISTSLSLAKRLQEISKNISEAEFNNLVADLLKELAEIKIETVALKEQIAKLQEENFEFRSKLSNDKNIFDELARIMENIDIIIPASITNSSNDTSNNLYSIFINAQGSLSTGVSNLSGQHDEVYWLYHKVCPKLHVHGLVELQDIPSTHGRRFCITKKGLNFLQLIEKKKIKTKNNS